MVSYSHSQATMAIALAVSEILNVKEWSDLSYSPSIVTMALSCIFCEIEPVNGRKSQIFYTPPVFSAPAWSGPVGV